MRGFGAGFAAGRAERASAWSLRSSRSLRGSHRRFLRGRLRAGIGRPVGLAAGLGPGLAFDAGALAGASVFAGAS